MWFENVFKRQLGQSSKNGNTHRNSLCHIPTVLERFTCVRSDEHRISGHEEGGLIPPMTCSFSKVNGDLLAVADEDGGILVLDTNKTGQHAIREDWRGHENAVFDMDWVPGENRLVTASGDQSAILWDVETQEKLATFLGHTSSLKTINCLVNDNNVFATGSRDGHVMIWDSRTNPKGGHHTAVNTIHNAHTVNSMTPHSKKSRANKPGRVLDTHQSVTAVLFQNNNTLLTAGSVDGTIKSWDLRKNYSILKTEAQPMYKFTYAGSRSRKPGFSCLTLDYSRSRLFASCTDDTIYQYNCANFSSHPVACFKGHKNSGFYIKSALSPDSRLLLSGSADHNAYVWQVDRPWASPLKLTGQSGEVSCVAWCQANFSKIVTLSDDSAVRIWRLAPPIKGKAVEGSDMEVGKCERLHKDIGTSVLTPRKCRRTVTSFQLQSPPPGGVLSSPASPWKGTMLCPTGSPAEASPSMKRTLVAMATGGLLSPSSPRRHKAAPRQVRNLVSPSIMKWFGKGASASGPMSRLTRSPLKSPRRLNLILSPRKLPLELGGNMQRVKRKATFPEKSPGTSKRMCTRDTDENVSSAKKLPTSPVASQSRVLLPIDNSSSPAGQGKSTATRKLFMNTPSKNRNSSGQLTFQSPTADLPNYVFDPQPRTPRASAKKNADEKTPNWLTRMRLQKLAEKPQEDGTTVTSTDGVAVKTEVDTDGTSGNSEAAPSTPSSSQKTPRQAKRAASSTKSAKKRTPRTKPTTRRSIENYFSPRQTNQ